MKTTLIYLGIAMMVLTSAQAKKDLSAAVVNSKIVMLQKAQNDLASIIEYGDTKIVAPVEDKTVMNPETALNFKFQNSIEAMIIENNKIIESTISTDATTVNLEQPMEDIIQENNQIIESESTSEVRPLYLDRTIEDTIAEDNAIIESNIISQAQPLDFDTINKKTFSMKAPTKLVGMN